MGGFIKLDRKFTEWEWYDNANTMRLFIHLLFKANYKDKQWHGITIKRGQCVTSISNLSLELNLTERQIRTALKNLKTTGELTSQTTSKYTLITIVNYGFYQDKSTDSDKQNDKQDGWQTTGERQASDEQTTGERQQHKKEKKERNIISSCSSNNACAHEEIYRCYEENIGLLTGIVVEVIDGYIELLCPEIVEYAIRQAVIYNKKSLGYVKGVCKSLLNADVKTPLALEQYITEREKQKKSAVQNNDPYSTGEVSRYGGI